VKTRNMVLSALFAALLAICAWISLPFGALRFTLQTFGLFLALLTLGGKWGSVSVFLYIAMGILGLPVFSGFHGGFATLTGPTGGFLVGFMLTPLLYWAMTALWSDKRFVGILALGIGLVICYFCGWIWYCRFAPINFFLWCASYLLPDCGKLVLAIFLSRRLDRLRP